MRLFPFTGLRTSALMCPALQSELLPSESLRLLSKRELIALLGRVPCRFDDADLACLANSTAQRLEVLRRRAREGKCVDEASEFARWVVASGLLKLCEGQGKGALHNLAKDTLYDCDCHWRNNVQGPWVAKSELEALNAKMDNLAALVGSLVQGGASERQAALSVIEGEAAS